MQPIAAPVVVTVHLPVSIPRGVGHPRARGEPALCDRQVPVILHDVGELRHLLVPDLRSRYDQESIDRMTTSVDGRSSAQRISARRLVTQVGSPPRRRA